MLLLPTVEAYLFKSAVRMICTDVTSEGIVVEQWSYAKAVCIAFLFEFLGVAKIRFVLFYGQPLIVVHYTSCTNPTRICVGDYGIIVFVLKYAINKYKGIPGCYSSFLQYYSTKTIGISIAFEPASERVAMCFSCFGVHEVWLAIVHVL